MDWYLIIPILFVGVWVGLFVGLSIAAVLQSYEKDSAG